MKHPCCWADDKLQAHLVSKDVHSTPKRQSLPIWNEQAGPGAQTKGKGFAPVYLRTNMHLKKQLGNNALTPPNSLYYS